MAEDIMQGPRLYHVYSTFWQNDYNITAADKRHLYHVDNSLWTPKKPDLTVHAGTDNKAPIHAVCKYSHFSRHAKFGLGDPSQPNQVTWEDLTCQSWTHVRYRWRMPLRNHPASEHHAFVWKRTSNVGVTNSSPSIWAYDNYKLVDEQSEQVIAVFTSSSHKSVDKDGKLEIYVDYGQEFDVLVLITVIALIEKHRRAKQNSASSGGGGGGGGGGGC